MGKLRSDQLTINDQALLLLDDSVAREKRNQLDVFAGIAHLVSTSFTEKAPPIIGEQTKSTGNASSFTVAARLGRTNYDDQARAEALITALKKLRGRPNTASYQSGRVIRSN